MADRPSAFGQHAQISEIGQVAVSQYQQEPEPLAFWEGQVYRRRACRAQKVCTARHLAHEHAKAPEFPYCFTGGLQHKPFTPVVVVVGVVKLNVRQFSVIHLPGVKAG